MNKDTASEFSNIINMLDIILYALKWQHKMRDDIWEYESIINVFKIVIKKLKICCINNIEYYEG